jgi:RNA polymerase sigma factor (sigma-70 family)
MVTTLDETTRRADFDDGFAAWYLQARRLAYAVLGDLATAEDVAAEALVRTLTRWHRVRALRHRDAWVLRTAAALSIDAARRRTVRAPVPEEVDADDDELVALDDALVDALVRLPARERLAVVLVEVGGCPATDAAAAMNIPVASLRRQVGRGLHRLRDEVPGSATVPWGSFHAID